MSLGVELESQRVAFFIRRLLGDAQLDELVFPLRQLLFTRREFLLDALELLASHEVERRDGVHVDAEPDDGIGEPGGRGINSAGVRRIRRRLMLVTVVDAHVRVSTLRQRRLGRELHLAPLQPRRQRVHLLLQPSRAEPVIHLLLHHERVGHLERALAEVQRRDRLRQVLCARGRGDDQRRHRGSPQRVLQQTRQLRLPVRNMMMRRGAILRRGPGGRRRLGVGGERGDALAERVQVEVYRDRLVERLALRPALPDAFASGEVHQKQLPLQYPDPAIGCVRRCVRRRLGGLDALTYLTHFPPDHHGQQRVRPRRRRVE